MNLLIDIKHPAQLNLFKHISKHLQEKGWNIIICYLDRGKLPRIIEKEYSGFECIKVGSSKGTKWSIFWNGNVVRTTDFIKLIRKKNIHICIAASSAPLALACKLTGTPVIQFYDDPERKRINKINEMLSDRIFFPPIIKAQGKVEIFNCLKEWSYLSPKYFKPNIAVLEKSGLKGKDYVFVREVSNKSFNYYNQKDALVCSISGELDDNIPVLLSLEDKTIREQFPSHWRILEEPIEDIHSLIYYAKLMVSSGDSMAREGAMLGVPSIYCGIREMKANELLIEKGILEHYPAEKAIDPINHYIQSGEMPEKQEEIRGKLLNEWTDMNSFMEQQVLKYTK
jgi:predicted glycosyltransferase